MKEAMSFIVNIVGSLFNFLNSRSIMFGETQIYIGYVFLTIVFASMVASVFWKGARG